MDENKHKPTPTEKHTSIDSSYLNPETRLEISYAYNVERHQRQA